MRVQPVRFSAPEIHNFSYNPKTRKLTIELLVGEHYGLHLASILHGFGELTAALRRTEEGTERDLRLSASAEQHRARCVAIARIYATYRQAGLKHRKAIHALFTDPQFHDLAWDSSDFGRIIRDYGGLTVKRV